MRILLDTNLLLWWLGHSEFLSRESRELIGDPENQILYSSVSLWEIHLKQSLGKLRLPEGFSEALRNQVFDALPLRPEHTVEIVDMPWHHRDPFDRMLLAQARNESLTLLTADEHLAVYGDFVRVVRKARQRGGAEE